MPPAQELRLAPVRCYSCNRLNSGAEGVPYCCWRMRLGQGPRPVRAAVEARDPGSTG